jgi:hypothetical protein
MVSRQWPGCGLYIGICLERLWKVMKQLKQDLVPVTVCLSCELKLFIHTITGKTVPSHTPYLLQMRLQKTALLCKFSFKSQCPVNLLVTQICGYFSNFTLLLCSWVKEVLLFVPQQTWNPTVIHSHKTCVYTTERQITAHMPNVAHGI